MKQGPFEEFDRQLREWLEPDPQTVDRLTASAFAGAERRASVGRAVLIVVGMGALVGGGLVARFGGSLLDAPARPGTPSAAKTTATTPPRTPEVASTVTGTSDGKVLVIEWPDGSVWAGNVAARGVRPPAGTGRVVVEGSAQ